MTPVNRDPLPARRRPSRRAAQRGAFLIEAMIAIVVFSVGMLAILGVVGKMSVSSSDARYRVEAAQYAESILAEMRLYDPATRAADYASGGTRFTAWTTRITAAGALPQTGADSGTLPLDITLNANQVAITITWHAPQDKEVNASGVALSHQYVITSSF